MNLLQVQNRIKQLMARWVAELKGSASMSHTDPNIASEYIAMQLLREIYDWPDLRNLNTEAVSFPGIDLAGDTARVAIQVTTTPTLDKVKHTLSEFADEDRKLYERYDRLIIYILVEKQGSYSDRTFDDIIRGRFTFDKRHDILDYRDLLRAIQEFSLYRAQRVLDILEEHFGGDVQADAAYTPPPWPEPNTLPDPGDLPPGSRIPFGRNDLFTGRVQPLLDLADALHHDGASSTLVTQTIQGMGGIGKTQLAVEFAHRYGRFFHGVHWIDAAQPDLIPTGIAACGAKMLLPEWSDEQPRQVELTLRAWKDGRPRLVILDNLERVDVALRWIPQLAGSRIRLMLTARRRDWPRELALSTYRLDLFQAAESLEFLRRYLPAERASDADLKALAERLGHLPLALRLAGRYLDRQLRLTVDEYLEQMAQALTHPSMSGFRADLGDLSGRDLSLAASFLLSWQELTSDEARRTFLIAGHCAPNQPVPYELLEKSADLDQDACDAALSIVTGLGLLEMDGPTAGPTIHPLLAEYTSTLPGAGEALSALANALAALTNEANETLLPAPFVPLRPHLEVVAPAAEAAALEGAGTLWNELGFHLRMVADYPGARAAYERALAIDKAVYGPDHPSVAADVNNLGSVLQDLGDLAGARAAFQRALAIDKAVYGPDHPSVAADVNNLGSVMQAQGHLAGARAAFERALAIDEGVYGPDHPSIAADVNNLASVLRALGDLAGARAAFERALAIDEGVYGSEHPNVAIRVNNLGSVLLDLGDLAGARAAFERALEIWTEAYGDSHMQVATADNNLGSVLRALGDLAGARAACERALAIDQAVYGPVHPNVARDVNNLASVLRAMGDLAGARAAFKRALAIDEAVYGPDHSNVASDVNNLGLVLQALGDLAGARAAFERALAIREACGDPRAENTRRWLATLDG